MIAGFLLFVPALLIGWLAVRLGFPMPWQNPWTGALLEIGVGAAVGVGIVSMAFFGLEWAHVTGRTALLAVDAVMAACGVLLLIRRRAKSEPERADHSTWIWLLRAAAAVTLLLFALDAVKSIEANPHGGWDAFSIWNVKAKFLAGGPDTWRNAMAPVAGGTLFGANHPGYPLLVPAAVASAWTIEGDTASATPAALGLLLALATGAILCGAISWLRGEAAGLIALLLLLATEGFASQVGSESADIPIGLYFLATLALLALAADKEWPRGTLLLAGFCCGLALWTKNEGVPFSMLALAVAAWKGGRKAAGWMALGVAPVVALWAAFKMVLVHGVEALFPTTIGQAISKVTDPSRWLQIAGSFAESLWQMGTPWAHPVVIVAVLAFTLGLRPRDRRYQQLWLAIPIVGLLAADFFAYLVTTADLTWQLSTSNVRLIVQVWPALLFAALLMIEPPTLAVRDKAEQKPSKGAKKLRKNRPNAPLPPVRAQ